MRVEYEAKTSNTVTRSIYSLYIRTVSRERTFDYNIDYSLMKKADEDFRHTVSIKLDKLPAKRD